ncbi:ABC transporter substrate-binding protein [Ramlibacter solisilvae]|uniref:Bicyclomycin resistance protein n=1 Tax=Ramlibacter tataouinensis TaxID=94132 RepID=A0A127JVF0_9BURK|nr:ABC transporter substrate-binding protein [Ramlibacter tataouinensis]AMO23996.1 bicyclomycin resistance protein [Ramlibacter tataouinensis]
MKSRTWAWAISLCLALGAVQPAGAQIANNEKVLRYAFPVAETGFDPAQINDLYSAAVIAHILEAPYEYDYLARPAKIVPNLAEAMPEVSPDFRTFTFRLRQGVYFADDPAFGGKPRELTAQDFVYTFKRFFDPKNKSPKASGFLEEKMLGTEALRKQAEATGKFDYDTEIEGLRALDRYTVQIKLAESRPRFTYSLADPATLGIVAREVVEKYGDAIMEHPVGTGPFVLKDWRRASKITLVRNPGFREKRFQAEASDAGGAKILGQLKGKKLPIVDKVIVSIIDEPQPRWLAFLNNEHDFLERLPQNFATHAIPNNKLAPNLAKRGIGMEQVPLSDFTLSYMNMTDPVIGGYTPEKVALRRAIALAINNDEEVRLPRRGQAVVAQGFIVPNTTLYDPNFRSEMGTHDRAKAMALLDMFGYTDKDGDGWRDLPDGKPLVLEYDTLSRADYRELDEVVKKNLTAVGIKINYRIGQWPEQLRAARSGKLMMWGLGNSATTPDSGSMLQFGYSKSAGQQNFARFANKRFDELYEKQSVMPDGPERLAVINEAQRILIAYMPYKLKVHRIATDLWQPWASGYKRHPFRRDFWQFIDIDNSKLPKGSNGNH